jgi:class 3 adenylate cyclase
VNAVGHRRVLLRAIGALSESTPHITDDQVATASAVRSSSKREAERPQLTVLFRDLVGSAELAARLDSEYLREVMRAYQAACVWVIARFEGNVVRFLGDGVLAYFGWPKAHRDGAERAVRAELALVEAVARLPAGARKKRAARAGIATDQAVVGNLISQGASDRDSVKGDAPNLAACLQALAEPGAVVISQATRRLVGGLLRARRSWTAAPQVFRRAARRLESFLRKPGGGPLRLAPHGWPNPAGRPRRGDRAPATALTAGKGQQRSTGVALGRARPFAPAADSVAAIDREDSVAVSVARRSIATRACLSSREPRPSIAETTAAHKID